MYGLGNACFHKSVAVYNSYTSTLASAGVKIITSCSTKVGVNAEFFQNIKPAYFPFLPSTYILIFVII